MLQQTQVDRVITRFNDFTHRFPNFRTLAQATPAAVITAWQGLGYNRRALALKKAAEIVTNDHNNHLSHDRPTLEQLPGIGPYTAGAIRVFAWDHPDTLIETNIRSVFIHEFFSRRHNITDNQLLPLIEQTLDRRHPGHWYDALMDYGSHLKTTSPNPSRRSRHHTVQSKFAGSNRQIRGRILKALTTHQTLSQTKLRKTTDTSPERLHQSLSQLQQEGFIIKQGSTYRLRT